MTWPRYQVCSRARPESLVAFDGAQSLLSTVLSTIRWFMSYSPPSLICLFLHMFLYCWLKKLRNQPSQLLLSLVCALFFGQLLFFFGFNFTRSKTICLFIASLSHYFLLTAFFSMNVMGFDMCRAFLSSLPIGPNRNR